jgi:hypothetical protein
MIIERIFEQSHIRRGRLATSPVFCVTAPDGARWRFMRKRDAKAFIERGGVCAEHKRYYSCDCGGSIVEDGGAR